MELLMTTAGNFTASGNDSVFPPQLPPDFIHSCFDENLSSSSVTPVRWQSYDPASVKLSVAIILLVYMVIGLPCNLLIIVSMLWKKLYRQPAHILLLNLALNDFLMCTTYIPINVVSAFAGEFIFGSSDVQRCHVCQISVVYVIFVVFNLHILALLSLDRFIFIKAPLHYSRWVTVKTTLAAVTVTWIVSIIISLPPLFGFGELRFTSIISTCSLFLLGKTHITNNINYQLFTMIEALAIPLALMVVTNTWLILIIRRQMKKMRGTKASLEEKGKAGKYTFNIKQKLNRPHNKRQLRVIKIYFLFILSNLVTWTPVVVNTLIILGLEYSSGFFVPRPLFASNYLFFMSQVVVHPVIQASMIPEIRNLFTPLFCRSCKKQKTFSNGRNNSLGGSERPPGCCSCCNMLAASILPSEGSTFLEGRSTAKRGTLSSISSPSEGSDKGFSNSFTSVGTTDTAIINVDTSSPV